MIKELFKKAGELHGHYCPGLAIGVRASVEALRILEPQKKSHNLYCIAENRACYLDGIQTVFGATLGGKNLEVRERGKTAFNFYDRESGKSVRLIVKDRPEGMSRDEQKEFILEAPFDEVFEQTPVRFTAPPDVFKKQKSMKCPRCGETCVESFLRIVDGETLCLDCAER